MSPLPRLVILYGSQTGTAQDCAERIGHEAARRHYANVSVMACDDYSMQDIFEDSFFLFVIATTGQGDQPDNMKTFFKNILRKQLSPGDFSHMSFAVCGLGDSSYQKFNFSAKKVFRRLTQLGAQSLLEPVYADEQHDLGVDGLIDPWLLKFWESTQHLHRDLKPLPDAKPKPKFSVSSTDKSPVPFAVPPLYGTFGVQAHERMTASDHFQDVRLLSVFHNESFAPGDVAVILPKNTRETADEFLKILAHINPNEVVQLGSGTATLPEHMSGPTTLRELAEKFFDLNSVPKRSFFGVFKHFCSRNHTDGSDDDDLHWEKFDEFSRAEGQPDLVDYTIRPKRTVLEVLGDFPTISKRLRLEDLLTLIPAIRPRYYSIANSHRKNPGQIDILYAVVDFKTMLKKSRTGLCTSYLRTLRPGDEILMHIKRGTLIFPPDPKCHLIMVGPGTGVAPFRSFIQEQVARGGSPMTLFFGCRNSKKDFFFAEEWEALEERGHLKLITAFSRDQDHKVYVQHRIAQYKSYLQQLLERESCSIFICGNAASMVGDVLESLEPILGKERIVSMQRDKMIQIEAWQ